MLSSDPRTLVSGPSTGVISPPSTIMLEKLNNLAISGRLHIKTLHVSLVGFVN